MAYRDTPGLGELLRYIGDLVDQGAEVQYRNLGLTYRPRYTPVLRALNEGAATVTEITAHSFLTQGAISQSVSLMMKEGLLVRHDLDDGRKSGLRLSPQGRDLVITLEVQWARTFAAIRQLEQEIDYPLLDVLMRTARALEDTDFSKRISAQRRQEGGADGG